MTPTLTRILNAHATDPETLRALTERWWRRATGTLGPARLYWRHAAEAANLYWVSAMEEARAFVPDADATRRIAARAAERFYQLRPPPLHLAISLGRRVPLPCGAPPETSPAVPVWQVAPRARLFEGRKICRACTNIRDGKDVP